MKEKDLKSPVWTILPFGVFIKTPKESGIECTTSKKPILKWSVSIEVTTLIKWLLIIFLA